MFSKILSRCNGCLMKHIKALTLMLQAVHGRGNQELIRPHFAPGDSSTECSHDLELFGEYCEATHESYMHVGMQRLKLLKELASNVVTRNDFTTGHNLRSLIKVAYDVRRSGSFKKLIAFPSVSEIVHRIGHISKFYRCAVTLTSAAPKLLELGKVIQIEHISARDIRIPELANRTATQVRCGGGGHFVNVGGDQLSRMIARWPRYRIHAELQLIIFYETHPGLKLYCNYVGCSKRSCYLCYNFIERHGLFKVHGCHQSLYSLWTVPEAITFANNQRAMTFKNALGWIVADLEQKMKIFRTSTSQRQGFATHNESVPNLSRISLVLPEQPNRISIPHTIIDYSNLATVVEEAQMETSRKNVGDTMVEAIREGPIIVQEEFLEAYQGQTTEALQLEASEEPEEPEEPPHLHLIPTMSNGESSGGPSTKASIPLNTSSPSLTPQNSPEPPLPLSVEFESVSQPAAKGECTFGGEPEVEGDPSTATTNTEHPPIDPIQSRTTLPESGGDIPINLMEAAPSRTPSPETPTPELWKIPPRSYRSLHRHVHRQQRQTSNFAVQPPRERRKKKRTNRTHAERSSRLEKSGISHSSTGSHRQKRGQRDMKDEEYECSCGLFKMLKVKFRNFMKKMRTFD